MHKYHGIIASFGSTHIGLVFLAALIMAGLWAKSAAAAPPPVSIPLEPENFQGAQPQESFGFLTGLQRSTYVLGDMWGLRTLLSRYGMTLAIQETSEALGNVTGGIRRRRL